MEETAVMEATQEEIPFQQETEETVVMEETVVQVVMEVLETPVYLVVALLVATTAQSAGRPVLPSLFSSIILIFI